MVKSISFFIAKNYIKSTNVQKGWEFLVHTENWSLAITKHRELHYSPEVSTLCSVQ